MNRAVGGDKETASVSSGRVNYKKPTNKEEGVCD